MRIAKLMFMVLTIALVATAAIQVEATDFQCIEDCVAQYNQCRDDCLGVPGPSCNQACYATYKACVADC